MNTPSEPMPISVTGSGDDVISFTVTETGVRIFNLQSKEKGYFSVKLKDGKGEEIALLVFAVEPYMGRRSEGLEKGTYYLDVHASGPWVIEITQKLL